MRLTGIGKFVLLILALGAALGGWRSWQNKQAGGSGSNFPVGNNGGNGNNSGQNGGNSGNNGGAQNGGSGGTAGDIQVITSKTQKNWLESQIARFNQTQGGNYHFVVSYAESRAAMHDILKGRQKPALWIPSSSIWPPALAAAWGREHAGSIVNVNDATFYRVLFRSPIVFLTTQSKARVLRPLLGGSNPWEMLHDLSLGRRQVSYGHFKYSHADLLSANSGMMLLGAVLADYADQTGQTGNLSQVATSTKFRTYLQELERGLIYDLPAESGSSDLLRAFVKDPARYDVIVAYESTALVEAARNRDLAVIYPKPTAVAEQVGCVLQGDWVTPGQRQGAQALLTFLNSPESLQAGLQEFYRPLSSSGVQSLDGQLSRYAGQGFQQTFSAAELPPYEALNAAAFQWRIYVVHKPVAADD